MTTMLCKGKGNQASKRTESFETNRKFRVKTVIQEGVVIGNMLIGGVKVSGKDNT